MILSDIHIIFSIIFQIFHRNYKFIMKKHFLAWALIISFSSLSFAQSGIVFDDLSMSSDILDMDRKYAIYLPPDYETSQRSYPVLYLLHGGGDDQTGWIQFGEVLHIADK